MPSTTPIPSLRIRLTSPARPGNESRFGRSAPRTHGAQPPVLLHPAQNGAARRCCPREGRREDVRLPATNGQEDGSKDGAAVLQQEGSRSHVHRLRPIHPQSRPAPNRAGRPGRPTLPRWRTWRSSRTTASSPTRSSKRQSGRSLGSQQPFHLAKAAISRDLKLPVVRTDTFPGTQDMEQRATGRLSGPTSNAFSWNPTSFNPCRRRRRPPSHPGHRPDGVRHGAGHRVGG